MATKKLTRSIKNKVFGGVLGGFAEYFDTDVTLLRVFYLALTIFSAAFPGVLLYILMLLMIPSKADSDDRGRYDDED